MVKYGIDVSYHQGEIDWNKVKNSSKAEFVIMRAGIGSKKDVRFEEYYASCKKLEIPVGAYWYSYATSEAEAVQEARVFLETIKGKTFEYLQCIPKHQLHKIPDCQTQTRIVSDNRRPCNACKSGRTEWSQPCIQCPHCPDSPPSDSRL